MVESWSRLLVVSPSVGMFNTQLDSVLGNQLRLTLFEQGWTRWSWDLSTSAVL